MDFFHPSLGYLSADDEFTLGDVQYPGGWLRSAPEGERVALGFLPVSYGLRPDDKFYWVSEVRSGSSITYTKVPKDLDALKALLISESTVIKNALLAPTDWEVMAAIDPSRSPDFRAMRPETITYRQAVRDAHTAALALINAAPTVDSLATLQAPEWPKTQ